MSDGTRLLDGKVAIVTGAGSGVGRGVAIALGRAGASRRGVEPHRVEVRAVVAEIEAAGRHRDRRRVRRATRPEHVDACVGRALDAYGGIDILVNAADDPRVDVPFLELTDEVMNASWQHRRLGHRPLHAGVRPAHARPR